MAGENKDTTECKPISPFDIAATSHVGLVREGNEDSYAYVTEENSPAALVLVADGIGGHENGDLASRLCSQTLVTSWKNCDMPTCTSKEDSRKFLKEKILEANEIIYKLNVEYEIQHPMGTTVVAAALLPNHIVIGHAGDSRAYRVRNGMIERLTQDHSFVAELLRKNVITPEEAQYHPFAHIISKSVGPALEMEPEISIYERKKGDRFMLCTDGLTNHLEDPEIEMHIYDATDPYMAAKNLLNSALRGGGEDNVTVACVFT